MLLLLLLLLLLLFFIIIAIIIFIIIIKIIVIIIIIFIIELTHSKTILKNTVEIEPQLVALDLKKLSQYSTVPSETVYWTCAVLAVKPICFNLLPNYLGIAPKEHATNVMMFTSAFHIFCNSLPKS